MAFATRERTAYHELSLSRRRKGYTGAWEVGIGADEKIGHEKVKRGLSPSVCLGWSGSSWVQAQFMFRVCTLCWDLAPSKQICRQAYC